MSSPWYTPTGTPATNAQGSSSDIRAEFTAIETALDKLPTLTASSIVVVNDSGSALVPLASVTVSRGGTGTTSLTDGGILLGSGANAITALGQPTNGQLVIGSTGADPVLATLTASTGISITEGAGSITVANTGVTSVATTGTVNGITLTGSVTTTGTLTLGGTLSIGDAEWGGSDLTVPNGGTGTSSFTDGGILLGSGTGAITATAALADGQMIVGDGTTDPAFESGATLRTSIGVGTGDTPTFTGLNVNGSAVTTFSLNNTATRLGANAGGGFLAGTDYVVAIGSNSNPAGTGYSNTSVGDGSLYAATTGHSNTSIGNLSLTAVTYGIHNTGIGTGAGGDVVSGGYNTCLGASAITGSATAINRIVIGYDLAGTADDQISMGKSGNIISNDFTADADWTRISDVRRKTGVVSNNLGLDFINLLRPVSYKWKEVKNVSSELNLDPKIKMNTKVVMTSLVAQEVKEALDTINDPAGVRFPGWGEDTNGQQYIAPTAFIYPIINSIKELTARIEDIEALLEAL